MRAHHARKFYAEAMIRGEALSASLLVLLACGAGQVAGAQDAGSDGNADAAASDGMVGEASSGSDAAADAGALADVQCVDGALPSGQGAEFGCTFGGGSSGGPGTTVQCWSGSQYCRTGTTGGCVDLPCACGDRPTCPCLFPNPGSCSCSDQDGAITFDCPM
jgi:hypothetical protein